ncbi:MAG TPA: aminotransferase class IV, partial [Blastocatellia bacterium]|nr:aminotransferase class IV [Blastocatellia bacterium]
GAWRTGPGLESQLLVFTSPSLPVKGEDLSITISPHRLPSHGPLAGIKRTSMLENLLAFEEARSRGFKEAVMLNERGEIVSATAGNIFWIERDEIFTPSVSTGCIAGITRGLVYDIAKRLRMHLIEGGFPIQRLLDARELFLTSTVRGIDPVASFDIKQYKKTELRMTRSIAREFQKIISDVRISP